MSLKDKASKINFGSLPDVASPSSSEATATTRPKTAPGLMMAHAADQRSELVRQNEELTSKVSQLEVAAKRTFELEEELRAWDGAKATRLLDPKLVTWSCWANRDPANFTGAEFLQLKEEISSSGGNVQPIKVRAVKPGGEFKYEVVFGHRRHRACLELSLPVLAVVDNLGEVDLFVQMDRENRSRKNLSAWEQGKMYLRALDNNLFSSNKQLAEKVGIDLAQLGKALAIARLPAEVIAAFATPLDLQFRMAKPLSDAVAESRDRLIERARRAVGLGEARSGKEVLDFLLAEDELIDAAPPLEPIVVRRDGKFLASVEVDRKGRAKVLFAPAAVHVSQLQQLSDLIESCGFKLAKPKK